MRLKFLIYLAAIVIGGIAYLTVVTIKKNSKVQPIAQTTLFTETVAYYYEPDEIKIIFDIGSRDALQSIELAKKYPAAKIYAFECNPQTLPLCYSNAKEYPNIVIVPKAVNTYTGKCSFYPIDPTLTQTTWKDGNPGASSLFEANGSYDHIEKYVQNKIEVECIRLDDFCFSQGIQQVDLMWMDLQGAELLALQSMGDFLDSLKLLHTELEMNPMYSNQALFQDVHPYLKQQGFFRLTGNTEVQFGADFIYLNALAFDRKEGIRSSKDIVAAIDVVVPACVKDLATLELCIAGIKKHIVGVRRIIVISDAFYTESAEWFDESKFPFSIDQLNEIFNQPMHQIRTGWYYQQLLKFYASKVIPGIASNVLVVDADTIFLHDVQFFDAQDRALYNTANEFHTPYFKQIARLLPGLKKQFGDYSGICHHMLLQRHFLFDLFRRVEKVHGKPFWKSFIECVDQRDMPRSGASEYEIYFNFLFQYYPYICQVRPLKWDNIKDLEQIQNFSDDGYDYISCHAYSRTEK